MQSEVKMDAPKPGPPGKKYFLMSLSTNCCPIHKYPEITSVSHEGDVSVVHRFKIVGEEECLLVLEQTGDDFSVDRFVGDLPGRFSVKYCSPLLDYDSFTDYLGVEKPEGTKKPLTNGQLFWLQFNIGYEGKTVDELKDVARQEAAVALRARLATEIDLFKIAGERIMNVFIKGPASYVDALAFDLPIVQGLGNSVNVTSKTVNKF